MKKRPIRGRNWTQNSRERIGGWTPNYYDSFLAHTGEYYRPFAKREAIGAVGAQNDKGHVTTFEPRKAQEAKGGARVRP